MKYHTLPPTITVNECAAIVSVTRRTVYNLIKNGEIKTVKIGRSRRVLTNPLIKRYGLDADVVLEYLNAIDGE